MICTNLCLVPSVFIGLKLKTKIGWRGLFFLFGGFNVVRKYTVEILLREKTNKQQHIDDMSTYFKIY